jgi:hypothetical protein
MRILWRYPQMELGAAEKIGRDAMDAVHTKGYSSCLHVSSFAILIAGCGHGEEIHSQLQRVFVTRLPTVTVGERWPEAREGSVWVRRGLDPGPLWRR